MTPLTRAEVERILENLAEVEEGHPIDEQTRDLADTALGLMDENERLTSLAKHERDNRGEQTKNKRVTHDVLTGMLRTAEARIRDLSALASNNAAQTHRIAEQRDEQVQRAVRAEARIAVLERLLAHVPLHADECRTCDEIGEHRYAR